jgi:hypothetical protein
MVRIKLMSDEEMIEWMEDVTWHFAVTMPRHPHEYCLRREQDTLRFVRAVATIWEHGYDRMYLRRPWRSLDVGEFYVWFHTPPAEAAAIGTNALLAQTILINRAPRHQDRLI